MSKAADAIISSAILDTPLTSVLKSLETAIQSPVAYFASVQEGALVSLSNRVDVARTLCEPLWDKFTRIHHLTLTGAARYLGGYRTTMTAAWQELASHDFLYNEFVVPNGLGHRYAIELTRLPGLETLAFGFVRDQFEQPLSVDQLREIDIILPALRSLALISANWHKRETTIVAAPYRMRRDAVFETDHFGRILSRNEEAAQLRDFQIVSGRLQSPIPSDQLRIAKAIHTAIADQRPCLIKVADSSGADRLLALALPVRGEARELLRLTSALLVVIDPARRSGLPEGATQILQSGFGLTRREAEVAGLVSLGIGVPEVASTLAIGVGTTRIHLKNATQKMRVHGQLELAALVGRLTYSM